MTDPTRRADAIARLGGVDNLSETFRILRERSGRIVESGDTICGSIATAAIIDLAEIALSAPDSDGAALRRLRKKMMDCWQDRIETKKRFGVNTPDRREAQAEANAFQIACFEIDGELAARQDTPTTNGGCNANEVQEVRKRPDRVQPVVPEAADSPGVPDVHLPRGTVGADAPQGADSMAESAGAPAMHGREPERVEPPAREPDEIEAWSAKASTAPIDEKGDTRYESDPRCRGTEYSRYVLCRSEIDDALAIMRRLRDERDDAEQAVREVTDSKNGAYRERDQLVCALSKLFPSWLGKHPENETWDHDWRTIVFVQLPTGQCSWHIHDSEAAMFSHLSRGSTAWDGHTTEEKYRRLAALRAAKPSPTSERKPDGYAYRYPSHTGGTVLRFNGGEEVNGSKPIESVPYWLGRVACSLPRRSQVSAVAGSLRVGGVTMVTSEKCDPSGSYCTHCSGHEHLCPNGDGRLRYPAECAEELRKAAQEPVWSEPNDHTKNVCAIRRRSDGYWWQCDSEHGAGWNDKRIRQAWTAREARLEVERHLQGQDVEIVQLMPEPKPEAAAATDAEREGDDVLSRWLALDKSLTQLEWLAAMSVVVDELCRRALRGGNHGSL